MHMARTAQTRMHMIKMRMERTAQIRMHMIKTHTIKIQQIKMPAIMEMKAIITKKKAMQDHDQ